MKLQTKLTAIIGLIMMVSVGSIFYVLSYNHEKHIYSKLKESTAYLFNQIIITQNFIYDHGGGVYIKKMDGVEPNPFLDNPEIKDVDGNTYTLLNPPYFSRLLSEYAESRGLFKFHMTSLKPLNPINKPDDFEQYALQQFEVGEKEITQIHTINGKMFFRYMGVLYMIDRCMECHAKQGYKVGDVRGGISIFIPMEITIAQMSKQRWLMFWGAVFMTLIIEMILYLLIDKIILRPVQSLSLATQRIKEEDYINAIPKSSNDELGELSESFNLMQKRILQRTQEIKESEEKYRTLAEAALDAIISTDSQGIITLFNRAATKIFGYEADEVIGKNITLLMQDSSVPVYSTGINRPVKNWQLRPIGKSIEAQWRRKDGTILPCEISISEYEIRGSLYFTSIIRDLTEKKRYEESVRQAEKMSSLGILVAGVAHELNNPLTGILGLSELLIEDEHIDEGVRNDLTKIKREAKRSARIVKNLLTFSRSYKNKKSVVRINSIIENIIELVQNEFRLNSIEIVRDIATDLAPVFGDCHQLEEAFLNIVQNAAQAMTDQGKGGIITIKTQNKHNRILLDIKNNGPAIDVVYLQYIFDPFFTTKQAGKGTGLGLSIVYGIIHDHNGTIRAENLMPDGVLFRIELPIERKEEREATVETDHETSCSKDQKILIVDDEESVLGILSRLLEEAGYEIDTASTGSMALEKAVAVDYDLIIADMKMPGIDGLELYKRITKLKPVRFIVQTGWIDMELTSIMREYSIPLLKKPFSKDNVLRVVSKIFAESQWYNNF